MSNLLDIIDRRIAEAKNDYDSGVAYAVGYMNALLDVRAEFAAELDKAPVVTGYIHEDGYILMDAPGRDPSKPAISNGIEYTARLIDITELKKEIK